MSAEALEHVSALRLGPARGQVLVNGWDYARAETLVNESAVESAEKLARPTEATSVQKKEPPLNLNLPNGALRLQRLQ